MMEKRCPEFKLAELTTPRLRLRQLTLTDVDQLVLLRSDEYVNRYLDRPATTSHTEAARFINNIISAQAHYWVITLKEETKLIGTICLWNLDYKNSVVEIGYELLPGFHGKGIMKEALQAIITFNSDHLHFDTLIGTTHSENIASMKLLENNGFKRDSMREKQLHAENRSVNEIVYSLKNIKRPENITGS